MTDKLYKTEAELNEIADLMAKEIKSSKDNAVSRYQRNFSDSASFINGKKVGRNGWGLHINKEQIDKGIYSVAEPDEVLPHNFKEITVARDLDPERFTFHPKGIELPTNEAIFYENVPSNFDIYDDEFKEFSKTHQNTRVSRVQAVDQKIIVNSKGGKIIQSTPYFEIVYSHGYDPIPTLRDICVVCNSEKDIRNVPKLIKHIADPTPDKRIKNSKTFSEAFHELHKISALKYGSLPDAGIPLSETYDVVMLTGVPTHEIFGHQFEEPIRHLNFGECGTFTAGQNINNKDIILTDNPRQEVEGFRTFGFTNIDAYGRPRLPRTHIKDGRVQEFLGSEYADPENLKNFLGLEKSDFVGNAVQHADGYFPQPRMTCTVLDGPTEDVDLEGKILLVAHEGHTNTQDKTYMVKAKEAYIVKNGEPHRVVPLQVTGGINQALINLVLLKDTSYQIGMCGKGDPLHLRERNASAPVSQFARNQLWKKQQVYRMPITDTHLKILTYKK